MLVTQIASISLWGLVVRLFETQNETVLKHVRSVSFVSFPLKNVTRECAEVVSLLSLFLDTMERMLQGVRSPYQSFLRQPVLVGVAESQKSQTYLTKFDGVDDEINDSCFFKNPLKTAPWLLGVGLGAYGGSASGEQKRERGVGHVMGVTYGYDAAGNLTSAGASAYTWNYRNRLTDTNINSTTTHYLYDYNDQRVQQDVKIGAGATTSTIYWNKLFETKGATTTLYVFLPNGELLATVEGNGNATSTYIAHTDHQGSTNVMSDKNGNLAQLATYYPFGAKRNNELPANGIANERGFIGQYEDTIAALSYLNARYYDATRGQFLSEDPMMKRVGLEIKEIERLLLDPQMQNYYSYAKNNPINLSDPSGEITVQQQIQTLQLQIQVLQNIVKLYQAGATSQADAAYARYQGIAGGAGTSQAVNTTGDKAETASQGGGVTNRTFNWSTQNYANAGISGATIAAVTVPVVMCVFSAPCATAVTRTVSSLAPLSRAEVFKELGIQAGAKALSIPGLGVAMGLGEIPFASIPVNAKTISIVAAPTVIAIVNWFLQGLAGNVSAVSQGPD